MLTRSLKTLLSGLIDYAGLFPPAGLSMPDAATAFARHAMATEAWMLGRFICPAARLEEFSANARALMPGTWATSGYREMADIGEPWRISALVRIDPSTPEPAAIDALKLALDQLDSFNLHHQAVDHGLARVDAIELLAPSPGFIDAALDLIPEDLLPAFEVPAPHTMTAKGPGDPRGFIAAMAGNSCVAKLRTGGVTPDAFPAPPDIARFLTACRAASVPFKATAGLHHPLRSQRPLTYAPDAPQGTMHGFLNVFLAAAGVNARLMTEAQTLATLAIDRPDALLFTDEGVTVRFHDRSMSPVVLDALELARAREAFALSFGSCSFDEPVADLRELGLL